MSTAAVNASCSDKPAWTALPLPLKNYKSPFLGTRHFIITEYHQRYGSRRTYPLNKGATPISATYVCCNNTYIH